MGKTGVLGEMRLTLSRIRKWTIMGLNPDLSSDSRRLSAGLEMSTSTSTDEQRRLPLVVQSGQPLYVYWLASRDPRF